MRAFHGSRDDRRQQLELPGALAPLGASERYAEPRGLFGGMGSLAGLRGGGPAAGAPAPRGGVAPVFVYWGARTPPAAFDWRAFSAPRVDASAAPEIIAGAARARLLKGM